MEKIRILYVDDEPPLLEIGKLYMERGGDFVVTTCESAPEAIRLLSRDPFDAIISDYQMPVMDGIAFLKHLREHDNNTPFIIFTGRGREEVVIEAMNSGADFYIQKGGDLMPQFVELSNKVRYAVSRRRNETALRESEERYRTILNQASDSIIIHDTNGRIHDVNRKTVQNLGYTRDELLSMEIVDIDPEAISVGKDKIWQDIIQGRSVTFESNQRRKDGSSFPVEVTLGPVYLEGGVQVIGIIRDITERKQAENALKQSEEHYRIFTENITETISVLDLNLQFTYISPSIKRLRGFTVEEAMKQSLKDVLTPGSLKTVLTRFDVEMRIEADGSGDPDRFVSLDLEEFQKDGTTIWVNNTIKFLRDEEGHPVSILIVARDITEQKNAESALKLNERNFRTLFDNAILGIFRTTPQGSYLAMNPAFARIAGYSSPEEMMMAVSGTKEQPFANKEDRDTLKCLLETKGEVRNFVTEIKHRDGHSVWIAVNAHAVKNGDNTILHYEGTIEDITEQILVGQALRESEEKYRNLVDRIRDIVWETTLDLCFTYINSSQEEVTGYTKEELIGHNLFEFLTEESQPMMKDRLSQRLFEDRSGTGVSSSVYEMSVKKKDGGVLWVEVSSNPVIDAGGKLTGFRGISRDVTSRKETEDALRQSEEQYYSLFNDAILGIFRSTPEGTYLTMNPAFALMYGYDSPQEMMAAVSDIKEQLFAHKEDWDTIKRFLDTDGVIRNFVTENRHRDGPSIWIAINAHAVRNETGDILHYEGTAEDITKRKQVEMALQESEEKYRNLVNNILDVVWETTQDLRFTFLNSSPEQAIGYSREEMTGHYLFEFLTEESVIMVKQRLSQRLLESCSGTGVNASVFEVLMKKKDGGTRWFEVNTNPVLDTDGKLTGFRGVSRDISSRKEAEEALIAEREQLLSIFDSIDEPIYVADPNTYQILYVNRSLSKILGKNPVGDTCYRELQNRSSPCEFCSIDIILAQKPAPYRWEHHNEALNRDYAITDRIIRWPDGRDVRFELAIDITERKRTETEIREAHKKLSLLSGITRHDILNKITALKGFIDLTTEETLSPVITGYLKEVSEAADAIVEQIAFTRQYEELGSQSPVWLSICGLVETNDRSPLAISCACPGISLYADPMLEKVFTNLLDNTLRHATGASHITVQCQKIDSCLLVTWEDDGPGIPDDQKEQIFDRGFGKNTGLGLFLTREILSITGITIAETGVYGTGVRFEILVPEGKWRRTK